MNAPLRDPEDVTEAEVVEDNGQALATRPAAMQSWQGASARAVQARQERERILREILVRGVDYGTIPHCGDKPALHKAGAEKIVDAFNLWPDFEELDRIEEWELPRFHYRYRCTLRRRGDDLPVSAGIGSCNSMENRYRWRWNDRECPQCGERSIIRSKKNPGWYCWPKKGGCGSKFERTDRRLADQPDKVPNDDVFTQVNTIDKIAQKRSMVAATLLLGFSEVFTQDLDDDPDAPSRRNAEAEPEDEEPTPRPSGRAKSTPKTGKPPERIAPPPFGTGPRWGESIAPRAWDEVRRAWHTKGAISQPQINRLLAIARDQGWTADHVKELVAHELDGCHLDDLPWGDPYNKLCEIFASFQPEGGA